MAEVISQKVFLAGLVIVLLGSVFVSGLLVSLTPIAKGPKGDQGLIGADGIDGINGIDGIDGIDGINGTNGIDGEKGDKGDTGLQGPEGPPGLYMPDYDSGWIDITDKNGKYFDTIHGLNNTEIVVDITGKTTLEGGIHQTYLGGAQIAGWTKAFGGTEIDFGSVIGTTDGGYAMIGWGEGFGSQYSDFFLMKTDVYGNSQWARIYNLAYQDMMNSVIQTSDGGYVIAGYSLVLGPMIIGDMTLVRTNSSGDIKWVKKYGGTDRDWADCVIQTNDGGYAIAGYTESFGIRDVYLVKTDSAGNMQWNKTYGGTSKDNAFSVVQTKDGGYALAGYTDSFGAGLEDFYLVKTDASGKMMWNKTYGTVGNDRAYSMIETKDGGYLLAGVKHPFIYDEFWLLKTDLNGNAKWNLTYQGVTDAEADSVIQTLDGGYAAAGYTVDQFGIQTLLVKTDVDGTLEWTQCLASTGHGVPESLIQSRDGAYVMGGPAYHHGPSKGGGPAFLVKTSVETGLAWTDSTANTITLYRGATDAYWNYVRVRIWKTKKP